MDVFAMPHEIDLRRDELFKRRFYILEVNIGDEAVDGGIDAGRLLSVQKQPW